MSGTQIQSVLPFPPLPRMAVGADASPSTFNQSMARIEQAFTQANSTATNTNLFNVSFLAWWATLPTTLPASPNVAWNNGGVLSVTS